MFFVAGDDLFSFLHGFDLRLSGLDCRGPERLSANDDDDDVRGHLKVGRKSELAHRYMLKILHRGL